MVNKPRKKAWNSWEFEKQRKGRKNSDNVERDIVTLSDAVKDWAKSRGIVKRLSEAEVISKWQEIVGETYAQHAVPVSLKRGCLVLKVADSSWRNELHYMQRELIGKINSTCQSKIVKEIVFTG